MEPFCSKVSRDSGCDPRSEEEKPNCFEARTTQHREAKRGGGRKSQVLHITDECSSKFMAHYMYQMCMVILDWHFKQLNRKIKDITPLSSFFQIPKRFLLFCARPGLELHSSWLCRFLCAFLAHLCCFLVRKIICCLFGKKLLSGDKYNFFLIMLPGERKHTFLFIITLDENTSFSF